MVRVATYNVARGTTGKGTPVDNAALAKAGASLGADILALEEVDVGTRRSGRVDQVALVAKACGAAHAFVAVRRDDHGHFGNGLLVRGTITEVERLKLRGQGWPGFRDRRAGLVAEVHVGEVSASVAVAHLSVTRKDALPELAKVLERLHRRPEPWIFLGDLNLARDVVRPTFEGAWLTLVEGGGDTFPARKPRARIDHVAVRGFEPGEVEVVDLPVSDHRALVVDLSYRAWNSVTY